MGENNTPEIEINIPVEVVETKQQTEDRLADSAPVPEVQEMPTITTLLQRKKLSAKPSDTNSGAKYTEQPSVNVEQSVRIEAMHQEPVMPQIETPQVTSMITPEPVTSSITASRRRPSRVVEPGASPSETQSSRLNISSGRNGTPPQFKKTLVLEKLDIKSFRKNLSKHKKCADMKKLDCLGYFATRFTQIAYFEVSQPGILQGVLGFGNHQLVTEIKGQALGPELLPSIFGMLGSGEMFVGSIESLRSEDQSGFTQLGFQAVQAVGAFPMQYKKSVTGLWLCATRSTVEITPKEIKALKKILTDLLF